MKARAKKTAAAVQEVKPVACAASVDTVVGAAGIWACYGPRPNSKMHNADTSGAHMWSVYAWCPGECVWRWMGDVRSQFLAEQLAAVLVRGAGAPAGWGSVQA